MEENSPLTMELRSLNLYGALESYEKSVRERKFLIAKTEDKITHLKRSLEKVRSDNGKLEHRSDQLRMQNQMQESRFQTETRKKKTLQDIKAALEKELKQRLAELEKQKSFMIKMESFNRTRLEQLQGVKQDFNERYKKIPAIGDLMKLQMEEESLGSLLKTKEIEIEELQNILEKARFDSKVRWNGFVDLCIKIASAESLIRSKVNEIPPSRDIYEYSQQDLPTTNEYEEIKSCETEISNQNSPQVKQDEEKSLAIDLGSLGTITRRTEKPMKTCSLRESLERLRNSRKRLNSLSVPDSEANLEFEREDGSSGVKKYLDTLRYSQSPSSASDEVSLQLGTIRNSFGDNGNGKPSQTETVHSKRTKRWSFSPLISKMVESGELKLGVCNEQGLGKAKTNDEESLLSISSGSMINSPKVKEPMMESTENNKSMQEHDGHKNALDTIEHDQNYSTENASCIAAESSELHQAPQKHNVPVSISVPDPISFPTNTHTYASSSLPTLPAPAEISTTHHPQPQHTQSTSDAAMSDVPSKSSSKSLTSTSSTTTAIFKVPARPRTPVHISTTSGPPGKERQDPLPRRDSAAMPKSKPPSSVEKPSFMNFGLDAFCEIETNGEQRSDCEFSTRSSLLGIFGEECTQPRHLTSTPSSNHLFDFDSMLFGVPEKHARKPGSNGKPQSLF